MRSSINHLLGIEDFEFLKNVWGQTIYYNYDE